MKNATTGAVGVAVSSLFFYSGKSDSVLGSGILAVRIHA